MYCWGGGEETSLFMVAVALPASHGQTINHPDCALAVIKAWSKREEMLRGCSFALSANYPRLLHQSVGHSLICSWSSDWSLSFVGQYFFPGFKELVKRLPEESCYYIVRDYTSFFFCPLPPISWLKRNEEKLNIHICGDKLASLCLTSRSVAQWSSEDN